MTESAANNYSPVSVEKNDWMAAAGVVFVSCLLYSITSHPGVGFHDSAELALRGSQPGATHSPGAPVHTVLSYLLSRLTTEPAVATNWISMLGGSLAAGVLCLIMRGLKAHAAIAIAAGLSFAFSFHVWGNSIVTETYSLSVFWLGCAIYAGLLWAKAPNDRMLLVVGVAYGLAMGAHFANILVLPAFIFLTLSAGSRPLRNTLLLSVLILIALLVIIMLNVLLAMNVAPFGQASPDSLGGIFFYMSGSEHEPLTVSGLGFYFERIYEHASFFVRHYFYVLIPAGFAGFYMLARRDWPYAGFLGLIFCAYMGYFTLFGAGDYFTMVAPAYFVFSLWVAVCVSRCEGIATTGAARLAVYSILPAVILLSLLVQLPGRFQAAQSNRAELFAEHALSAIPQNSIVIAGWREFTVLAYYQEIFARRPDLTIILPARTPRHYPHGDVDDYRVYIDGELCRRPVVTNKLPDDLVADFDVSPLSDTSNWYRLEVDASVYGCEP